MAEWADKNIGKPGFPTPVLEGRGREGFANPEHSSFIYFIYCAVQPHRSLTHE